MEKPLKNIEDPYKWSLETVEALRAGDFSRIDIDELINEIGSIASGLRRELLWVVTEMIESMLLMTYLPANYKEADAKLANAHSQFRSLLEAAPSLRDMLDEVVAEAYHRAKVTVNEDFELTVPELCPFSIEQIMEDPFDRLVAEGRLA